MWTSRKQGIPVYRFGKAESKILEKNIYHANINPEKAGVAILLPE